jgi:hypothetical protein
MTPNEWYERHFLTACLPEISRTLEADLRCEVPAKAGGWSVAYRLFAVIPLLVIIMTLENQPQIL